MNKNDKFVVIGGQYERHCYGTAATLRGAKCLASRNVEYWDNWQGWRTPAVYAIEDTMLVETEGMITYCPGQTIRVPKPGADPVAVKTGDKWYGRAAR